MSDFFDTPRRGRCASTIYAEFLDAKQGSTSLNDLILCAVVRKAVERQISIANLARETGLPNTSLVNVITHHDERKTASTVVTLMCLAEWAGVEITVNNERVLL